MKLGEVHIYVSSSIMGDTASTKTITGKSGTNRFPNSCILRIQHELESLVKEPVPFIYTSADESDITSIKALIIGPLETPYAVSATKLFCLSL